MPASSTTVESRAPTPRKPTQVESLVAGTFAGAVEGFITYPAEFVKTRAQFASTSGHSTSLSNIVSTTFREKGIKGFYSGVGALASGNALKAGVRFLTYDTFKEWLRTDDGKLTPTRTLMAGLAAGTAEAAIAVTPSETIKTKLVQDAQRAQPMYSGTINGTITICRTEGFGGIYRGLGPTMIKQASNSAVRFTSYSVLRDTALQAMGPPSGKLPWTMTFAVGAGAGIITVYTTMPFDTIKTRMQSLQAKTRYRNSIDCLAQTVKSEGVLRLWGGTIPRLVRLSMSGGIVFTVYEACISLMLES